MHQQVIRLIVEPPLTDNQIRPGILHHLDHLRKFPRLILLQLLVFLHTGNVQLMLRFWAGRFEGTCEDGKFGVTDDRRHLGMRHVFVNEDTFDESRVC